MRKKLILIHQGSSVSTNNSTIEPLTKSSGAYSNHQPHREAYSAESAQLGSFKQPAHYSNGYTNRLLTSVPIGQQEKHEKVQIRDNMKGLAPQDARAHLQSKILPAAASEIHTKYYHQGRFLTAPHTTQFNNSSKAVKKILEQPGHIGNASQNSSLPRCSPPPYRRIMTSGQEMETYDNKPNKSGLVFEPCYRKHSYSNTDTVQRILRGWHKSERYFNSVIYFYEDTKLPPSDEKSRTAYVGSIDEVSFTSHELRDLMSKCGRVEKIKYLLPFGDSQASAFVT